MITMMFTIDTTSPVLEKVEVGSWSTSIVGTASSGR